jgi:hypothetical protein
MLPHITDIFNTFFFYPTAWKVSKVIPIAKISDPHSDPPKDYRPISVLPALSKALEIVMRDQIVNFFGLCSGFISVGPGTNIICKKNRHFDLNRHLEIFEKKKFYLLVKKYSNFFLKNRHFENLQKCKKTFCSHLGFSHHLEILRLIIVVFIFSSSKSLRKYIYIFYNFTEE